MTGTEREELRKLRGGGRRLRVEREILARQRLGSPGRRDRRGLPVHEAHQTEFHVVMMARVLGVCSSGFYASLRRRRSAQSLLDDDLLRQVRDIHRRGRGTYGAPRSRAELVESALRRGRKRIAHLMQTPAWPASADARGRAPRAAIRRPSRRWTWSTAPSRPMPRTASGWPASPTSRPGTAPCIWRP